MVTTLSFDDAKAGEPPVNPPPTSNVFADLEPPAEAFDGVNTKYAKQHVLLVLDTSGSMRSNGKIDESNLAKNNLISELAVPDNKDGFEVTEIPFSGRAKRTVFAQSAVGLTLKPGVAGGGTNFEVALTMAKEAILELDQRPNPEGYKYFRPVIIFMSDGHSIATDTTIETCKELADIIAIAFGADANKDMLAKIASDGKVHRVGTNGGDLAKFLAAVGKTISDSFQAARV